MKNIILGLLLLWSLQSCTRNSNEDAPYITNQPEEIEKYAEQALQEAAEKLDSLKNTELLKPKTTE
jgi:hypothetical protein